LSSRHTLDLVTRLRTRIAAITEREQALAKDLRTRRFAVQRRRETAQESQQAKLESDSQEIHTECEALTENYRAVYERRRQRVERLANSAKRNLPKRIEEERSRYLGQLQWRRRKAEAKFQTEKQALESKLAQWEAGFEVQRQRLRQLERRAHITLGSHGGLKKKLPVLVPNLAMEETVSESRGALLKELTTQLDEAEGQLRVCLASGLAGLFRLVPLLAWCVVALVVAGIVFTALSPVPNALPSSLVTAVGLILLVLVLHWVSGGQIAVAATGLSKGLHDARLTESAILGSLEQERKKDSMRLTAELDVELALFQEAWDKVDEVAGQFATKARAKLAEQPPRVLTQIARQLEGRIEAVEQARASHLAAAADEIAQRNAASDAVIDAELAKLDQEEQQRRAELAGEWADQVLPLQAQLHALRIDPSLQAESWDSERMNGWQPPSAFPREIRVGELQLDLAPALPQHESLALPEGQTQLSVPLTLGFPECGGLFIETDGSCDNTVADIFNQTILNILTHSPAGKAAFTILDPVGLGQNFAGLMHLADYEEQLINRRIWTQRDQIDERLAELNEHIEKVIQMYLRNEYETITQYNEHAGTVAEKYHFLVIADFPTHFSETAAQRLQSIALSGPRCGVFTLMHWNRTQKAPDGFVPDELRQNSLCLRLSGSQFVAEEALAKIGARITLDAPPTADTALTLVHHIGKTSIDSNRVEVPFETIAPAPGALWTESTTTELRVPIGRTGATKLQYLAIGKGTRQHALFAGKTGSGKSTLFHVIITNLALHCSPDEVEFYLIDFKKGVEFKCYAEKQLPHARVIAIESDREFGLSVLQRVDEELRRRGDLFRALGAQDIAGYKRAGGKEPMPRSLLIIDEFQEFFVEDDTVAQNASVLFDRIVRQGRAFGIHVLLGSQTLGGAYTLARATLGQMVIRVALQCNEADAYLIMDENNPAPRLLTRPGEGIYNDAAGAVEGNSPFQVVWLGDALRDQYLARLHQLASERHAEREPPVVFEGNAPADIATNHRLAQLLGRRPTELPAIPTAWLGAPNAIKGPTEVNFVRQSGNHLLIVGQREEATTSMLGLSLLALAAQCPAATAQFVFFHSAAPGTADAAFLEGLFPRLPHPITLARANDVAAVMTTLHEELQRRTTAEKNDAPPLFVFVHGLHKFKKLRHEDEMDFSFSSSDDEGPKPGAMFNTLLTEGASHGIHLIVTLDTYNNVSRCLSRKALTEFEMRVIFQMSANDSASLIDSAKGANLGLHRALLYNEQQGLLETFRPYALPSEAWIEQATKVP
jgi:S-DNA-T family DNA segregation ATPase FtsK/SpoIIIE